MPQSSIILYGANGYTGQLIAKQAVAYNLHPILTGRKESAIVPLAKSLTLPYKIADLNNTSELETALEGITVVIHAAGPYQYTAKQMVEACLKTGTHYLDINGDVAVFEMLKKYDEKARRAGIMVMPGVGFDVVPTDCIALLLKKQLPDAVSLKLAFASLGGGLSHGTATTMVSKLGEGGAIRKQGKIIRSPIGQKGMWVDFGLKKIFVMNIPWGDISTAYTTTSIPNIETYTSISPKIYRLLKLQPLFNWLLRTSFTRNIMKKKIDKLPAGPDDEGRKNGKMLVWGQVTNAAGNTATARLSGPDGYTLTAHSSLIIARKVLEGKYKTGYQTPAGAYGEELVLEIPGVSREAVLSCTVI
ncbi:MAG: saccharopine dehydrogenase NADP-binding domain-containing protein [Chitinophagaceae bacterium]